ncbi:MAG: glucose-6-phosphate isomerase [Desulfuromonadaceae bacterium]|nr:glucose-6-phosphate isomerase [Desulfuromonadaceae bacterium]
MEFRNLDQHPVFCQLKDRAVPPDMRTLLDARRVAEYACSMEHDMFFNYAATPMTDATLDLLQDLAQQAGVLEQYHAVLNGAIMNASENRMVLHHLTRGQCGAPVVYQGVDLGEFYRHEHQRIAEFSHRVHSGEVRSSAGHAFKYLCQIGIGGSDLGPRALYLALEQETRRCKEQKMEAEFISNVDPDDAARVLRRLDLARTLFILVSKSGTTQETLTNAALVREALNDAGLSPTQHMVVVTAQGSPLAQDTQLLERFYIDDFVGGRFSSTSAVGGVLLTLCFGAQVFAQLLEGAHHQDKLALQENIRANPALLDALIGVYLRNCLGYSATAMLPYSQALQRFPAHLQQLDMESNGKHVNRSGQILDYATGPVIFGEPGTNGQHSFYQLLHQGTEIIPVQFVGFVCSQSDADRVFEGSTSQQKLNANLAAQIVAFAKGKDAVDPNNSFDGGRPASLIHAPRLTPRCLGALLAHYENKVMFQGFLWNLNSFDQPGVQLGKLLAGQVLRGTSEDGALRAYADCLGIGSVS